MSPSRPALLARRLAVTAAGVGLALAAVLGAAESASAHDELGGSDPADGATVSTLSAVTLQFEEAPLVTADATAQLIAVTGPDGRHYETACAAVDGTDVAVPVALGAAGAYQVVWRVVSDDGHPVSGQLSFTYAPGSTTDAAAGAESSPCAAVAASGAGDQGVGWVAGVSALAVLVGIFVALAMLYLQARKKSPGPDAGTGADGTGTDGPGTDQP